MKLLKQNWVLVALFIICSTLIMVMVLDLIVHASIGVN